VPDPDTPAPSASESSPLVFELYQDAADEWRWRATNRLSDSDHIIADSGEGYARYTDAVRGIMQLKSVTDSAAVRTVNGTSPPGDLQFRHETSVEMDPATDRERDG